MLQRSENMAIKIFNKKAKLFMIETWQLLTAPYLLPRRCLGTELPSATCFKCGKVGHRAEKKLFFLPQLLPWPCQTVDKQDTEELIALLCQDEVGRSPQIPVPQESLSALLGLAAEYDSAVGCLSPTTTEETGVAVQAASKACHFNRFRGSFTSACSGEIYPSQFWQRKLCQFNGPLPTRLELLW